MPRPVDCEQAYEIAHCLDTERFNAAGKGWNDLTVGVDPESPIDLDTPPATPAAIERSEEVACPQEKESECVACPPGTPASAKASARVGSFLPVCEPCAFDSILTSSPSRSMAARW